jgi:hypothetical protein
MNFWEKYKNIILLLSFLLVAALLGYLIFLFFFKPIITNDTNLNNNQATGTTSGFPTSGTGTKTTITDNVGSGSQEPGLPQNAVSEVAYGGLTKTEKLNDSSSVAATLSGDGSDVQFYNKEDGKFYKIDKDGKTVLLSDKVFHDVEKVTWAGDKDKAVLEYPDGSNIVYDFASESQTTLPKHWQDFNFSPDSEKLVSKSMGIDTENRWLIVSNLDGSQVLPLESMGENADTVYSSWSPSDQIVAMYTEGKDYDRQEVYFVGLNGENFKSTIVEGRGFDPKWSEDGSKLLYSVYSSTNDMKPNLWVVDAEGDQIGSERKNLNVETWADKCTYANATELYCAVPESLPEGAGVFKELAKTTKDNLYKINTATGQKSLVAVPDGSYNMSDLIISENGYNLYFTDETTSNLYKIKLK